MRVESFYHFNSLVSKLHIHTFEMLAWHISKYILNRMLPDYYERKTITNTKSIREYTDLEVIISLTTFPDRIETISLVLESLFRQSIRADGYILWLADSQFSNKTEVKKKLEKYIDLGLEIKYCDDLRSHKKYYYTMIENPNSIVVTCDDDILYSENMLERLLTTAQKYPGAIICERAHEITFTNGQVAKYNEWNYRARGKQGPSLLLCPTGGAGCLYPPKSLSEHVFDKDILKEICFYADDIWLKCMSYLAGTPVVLTRINGPEIIDTIGTNKNGLAKVNVGQNQNDRQFEDTSKFYSIDWVSEIN